MLSDPPEGAASLAAIKLGVDDERRCPHCGAGGAVSRGKARGLRRFRCNDCEKTFGALTLHGGARHPSRKHQRLGWQACPGRAAHLDGQQPPQPDQGLPAWLPRHRHQVPRQLSEVVPSHRTRRPAVAQGLP